MVGWGLLYGFLCLVMIVVGLETALHFRGPAIDGPFQLYNALRRISAGQRAGVDFQFFHGIGIPYLHYLPFRALGGTFIASEITRELMSVLVHPIIIVLFLRFFIGDWTRALVWSVIVMALSIALRMTSMLLAVNSLLGIRSMIPTLLPVLLCLPIQRWVRVSLTGIALGGALVMGTEQGLSVSLALVIATTIIAWRSEHRAVFIADTAAALAIGGLTLVGILTAVGGVRGMHGALDYNFRLVPLDQYWYFGAPPNLFLSSWGAIPRLFGVIPRIAATLLVGVVAVAVCVRRLWVDASSPREREHFAFATLSLYGLISCASLLGTFVNVYVQPELRILLLLGAVWLDGYLPRRDDRLGRRLLLGASRSVTSTAIAALLIMIAVVPSMFVTMFVTMPHVLTDHIVHRVGAEYSGIWPKTLAEGQAFVDAHRNPDGSPPTIWSTYAGLLEARNGRFHPSFDYIIHALGPANRSKYVQDFVRLRPQLVQTVLPTYTQFEPWIEATSWDFYAALLKDYSVIGATPWSLFWARSVTSGPMAQEVWSAHLAPGTTSVDLPAVLGSDSSVVLLQVELAYVVHNPLHVLPVVGGLPRYLVFEDGALGRDPITLDPYTAKSRFPVVARRGAGVRLGWSTFSLLPGASIEVTEVTVWYLPLRAANLRWLTDLVDREINTGHPQ